ncbi:hypothetical protein QN372_00820 [Undibacterium sp. RTI2.1]|uniref:phage tail tape measure protein n=1 Tax=unclassified Undibacterium TaxID=2630295 RepID=UPI002AB35E21|nr:MULTISPECIES: phage tail tape measure protein [unclassified Undibacterium]MDY7537679.1 hypothetical protein [Undibacterium sp. 5I1]MEB0029281.1 hypothetical protein [Undibacterium sp. RTI2.1]MEB0115589.1 hypothetical protein [Undibacterium sp. RTI2.2]MEB0256416.1 hypothetical protein [Undibacterium sp. 5I1]
MSNDKTIEYAITAEAAGWTAAMQKVQESSKVAAKQIQDSFKEVQNQMDKLASAFKSVTSVIGTMTAIIAGGSAFKAVISESVAWTGEAKKLSVQLGVTTERASVLMVAMRHLGIDSEVLTMAAGKMSKQIATNGQAFEKLGVKVKDSAGQYRPTLDIMGEVNAKLKEIQNPIEQNIAGTQVYGKSWNDVRATLKLTTEEIKAAEQKTKDLGLVVGDEGVAQAKKYKESINDMKLVMTSLEVQAGNALLPTFVKLGGWLSGVGPVAGKATGMVLESLTNIMQTVGQTVMELWEIIRSGFSNIGDLIASVMGGDAPGAMEIFSNACKVVEIAFVGLKVSINLAVEVIQGVIEALVVHIMRMAATVERALHGDFAGAKKAWAAGTAEIEEIAARHAKKMVDIASAAKDKIDDIAMRPQKQTADIKDKTIKGGPTYDFGGDDKNAKEKTRVHEWEAKLGADKDGYAKEQAIAGTAREYDHTMERDYWKNILDTVKLSKEEKAQVEKKYYAETALIRKDGFEAEMAGEKASLENYKNNHLARLDIAQKIYNANVARYGAESKEAKAAMAEIYKEQRAYAEQSLATSKVIAEAKRNAELSGIDAAEQAAELAVSLHQSTNAKLLQQQEEFEAKRYQIKMQALIDQEQMMRGSDEDPVALAQIHLQIEALEQAHQQKLGAIRGKAAQEQNKYTTEMYGNIQSGMQSVIAQTLQGTLTLKGMMLGVFQAVTNAIIDMLAKQAAEYGMNLILERLLGSTNAVSQVTANAAVAGSAAFASTAAIPIIGPGLAPAAALAAQAGAMSFAPIAASAMGGYDIPANLNPVVQTHAREMILPSKHADVIRNMADNGGGSSSAMHFNITAMDAQSVKRLLMNEGGALVSSLKAQARNFRGITK